MAGTETDPDAHGAGRTVRRVYRLPEALRAAINERRAARGQSVFQFVEEAITGELPALLAALAEAGLKGNEEDEVRPARLPVTSRLLADLRSGSHRTGLPGSRLLLLCLAKSASRQRRRGSRADVARSRP